MKKFISVLVVLLIVCTVPASKPIGQTLPFFEDFDSVGGLTNKGWLLRNNSQPGNPIFPTWFLGDQPPEAWFAHSRLGDNFLGQNGGYLAANYRVCGSTTGIISLWAITPAIRFGPSNEIRFWLRSAGARPDSMQILFAFGANADPGVGVDSIGDFTNLLEIVNGELTENGFPIEWTEYVVTLNLAQPQLGRIGFRYVVPDAGPDGVNSDYIGIDTLSVTVPFPPIKPIERW